MLMLPRSYVIDPYFILFIVLYCKMYGQMLLRPILFVIMGHVLKEPCGCQDVNNPDVIRLLLGCLFVILV